MIHLENDVLKIGVNLHGAELRSVVNKATGEELMWSGDGTYWNRVSPVLFPTVGKVFNGAYQYNGDTYHLSQHGFLRDQDFKIIDNNETKLVFSFQSTAETLACYPFKHEVRIAYELIDNSVTVHWYVFNHDDKTMFYSIGAHPAFAMHDGQNYEFELESVDALTLVTLEGGHVSGFEKQETIKNLPITTEGFKNDAIVFTGLNAVSLVNLNTQARIRCSFPGFDYVGLWTTYKNERLAPFVCIEPWLGITDQVGGYHDISEKLSIKTLSASDTAHHAYRLEFL